jgi:hypothetical protein
MSSAASWRLKAASARKNASPEIDEDITREFDIRLSRRLLSRRDEEYLAEYRRYHLAGFHPAVPGAAESLYQEVVDESDDDYSDVYSECSKHSWEAAYEVENEEEEEEEEEEEDEVTMNELYYSSCFMEIASGLPTGGTHPSPLPGLASGLPAIAAGPLPPPLPRRFSETRPPPRPPLPSSSYYVSI